MNYQLDFNHAQQLIETSLMLLEVFGFDSVRSQSIVYSAPVWIDLFLHASDSHNKCQLLLQFHKLRVVKFGEKMSANRLHFKGFCEIVYKNMTTSNGL